MKRAAEILAGMAETNPTIRDLWKGENVTTTNETATDNVAPAIAQPAAEQITTPPPGAVTVQTALPQRRITLDLLEALRGMDHPDFARVIIERELAKDLFDQDWRMARVFQQSGQFNDLKGIDPQAGVATAMAKVQLGRPWGMSVGDSIQYIFFVNGRPGVMNEFVAAKMREAGYDWDVQWYEEPGQYETAGKVKKEYRRCVGCRLWLKKYSGKKKDYLPVLDREGNPVSEAFLEADAIAAKVWEKGKEISLLEKATWQAYPRDLYYWRTIARLKRYHCPEVMRNVSMAVEAEDAAEEQKPMPAAGPMKTLAERIVEEQKRAGLVVEATDGGAE